MLSVTISVTTSFAAELVILTALDDTTGVTLTVCHTFTNLNQKLHDQNDLMASVYHAYVVSSIHIEAMEYLLQTNSSPYTAGCISAISA